MDLLEKKMRWDVRTIAAEPTLYYGKMILLVAGAFLLGRAWK